MISATCCNFGCSIDNELIDQDKKSAALNMLLEKLNIFITGAKKRGKKDSEINEFYMKYQKYLNRI